MSCGAGLKTLLVAVAVLGVGAFAAVGSQTEFLPPGPVSPASPETTHPQGPEPGARSRKHQSPDRELVARDTYLMGTRATLATYAVTRPEGLETLEAALAVLEASERELSTWRRDSAISSLNRHPVGTAWPASPSLCSMFTAVFDWHRETEGAFDPGIGRLISAWDLDGDGHVPSEAALANAQANSGLRLLIFDRFGCQLTRQGAIEIDVGAFGKGEALDRVETRLGPSSWMINLGGQIQVGGPAPDGSAWSVSVAHPLARNQPFLRVPLREGSLSTSGGGERDRWADGVRVGHILDPRTGRPAAFRGSVTVWHRRGLAADALSTALFVMGPDEGLRWATARGVSACYLIPKDGTVTIAATAAFAKTPGLALLDQSSRQEASGSHRTGINGILPRLASATW